MNSSLDAQVKSLLEQNQPQQAIQQIITELGPELRGYLRGTLGSAEDGDDVFQELSLALWERLCEFRFECSLRTFCYAIAHKRVIKRLQRYSRRNVVRLSTSRCDELRAQSLSSLLEHQRKASLAALAAEELEPREREVLILRAERNLSFSEIAAVIGAANEASARQRYHRAKERLRALIQTLEAEPGSAEGAGAETHA